MSAESPFDRYVAVIDQHLEDTLRQRAPYTADMAGYFFGWLDQEFRPVSDLKRGKRVRPVLTLLICEAISGSYQPALPLAIAVELIHNYSLIHDDIADRDEERRGRPTVWKIWGDGLAINTGSVLYTLAYQSVTRMDAPPEKRLQAHDILEQTSIRLSEGQHWDLTYENRLDVTQEMYLRMIDGKTAALIECATWLGALAASEDPRVIDSYRQFGYHLGLAFQIQDDYLGIWGDPARTGKPAHSDLRNKKKSLPVTYTLSRLEGDRREAVLSIYRAPGDMTATEITQILAALEAIDTAEYIDQLAAHHTAEALRYLDAAGIENPIQAQIRALATSLLGRMF
jgi:geranylgeranyl diphosphate synthase type I